MQQEFTERKKQLQEDYLKYLQQKNQISAYNGLYSRYLYPILTSAHIPLNWRYDFNPTTNPFLMQRFGINAVFNAGAIKWNNKYILIARVEV